MRGKGAGSAERTTLHGHPYSASVLVALIHLVQLIEEGIVRQLHHQQMTIQAYGATRRGVCCKKFSGASYICVVAEAIEARPLFISNCSSIVCRPSHLRRQGPCLQQTMHGQTCHGHKQLVDHCGPCLRRRTRTPIAAAWRAACRPSCRRGSLVTCMAAVRPHSSHRPASFRSNHPAEASQPAPN